MNSSNVRLLAGFVTVVLLALHIAAFAAVLPSALDHDEAEYLHASWLMNHGKRIYRDFMEDHPPYLFQLLNVLQPSVRTPELPLLDVRTWTMRSRVLMMVCGTIAVLSIAGIVGRATRSGTAALLTLAAVLGSTWTWLRGVVQIRPDAPTLMLFWGGVLLLLWDDDDDGVAELRGGAGMALVVAAEIWNPKWPLCGLVVGLFFLRRLVRGVRRAKSNAVSMVAPSAVVAALFVALTVNATTLREYVYFNFILKSSNMVRFRTAPWIVATFRSIPPFSFTSTIARPAVVLVLFIGAAWLLTRGAQRLDDSIDRIAIVELLAIMAAAAIEVRFVYTYPSLWPQYYLMWSFAAAALLGIALALVTRELRGVGVRDDVLLVASILLSIVLPLVFHLSVPFGSDALASTATAIAFAFAWVPTAFVLVGAIRRMNVEAAFAVSLWGVSLALVVGVAGLLVARRTDADMNRRHWASMSFMQRTLAPNETVWLSATLHPIAAFDASYFWYSPQDLIPDTLAYIRDEPRSREHLPQISERDLPPCRIVDGSPTTLRYTLGPAWVAMLPTAARCQSELQARGLLRPTRFLPIYEAVPAARTRP